MDRINLLLATSDNHFALSFIVLLAAISIFYVLVLLFFRRRGEKLEWQNQCVQTLIRTLPDPVWLKDKNGVVLACNPALADLYAIHIEDILGKTDFDLLEKEVAENFRKCDLLAIEEGKSRHNEVTFTSRSGEIRLFETIKAPVYDTNGALIGVLGTARDITEKRRMEEKLRISEQKFSAAFRSSPDAIAITLPEDGTVVDVNDAFLRVSGYGREELIGRNRDELNTWVDKEQFGRCFCILRGSGFVRDFEATFQMKCGQATIALVSAELIEIDSKEHVLWTTRDITAQRQVESALRSSQLKFSATFHRSPNALALVRESDGFPTEVNDAFVKLSGYDREELFGHTAFETSEWCTGNLCQEFTQQLRQDESETELITKTGEKRICQVLGITIVVDSVTYVLWTLRDVTENQIAEEALRVSEQKFSAAFSASPDGIVIIRNEDLRIIDVNEAMILQTGFNRHELLGRPVDEMGFWANPLDLEKYVAELHEHGRVRELEVTMKSKCGDLQFGVMSAELFWINGSLHTLAIFHDMTRRHMAEIEIKKANSRLAVLSARLLQAQESERRNLAHELHDEVGQLLTAQRMALEWLCLKEITLADQIQPIIDMTDRILSQIRQLSLDLRPPQLDDLGLSAAIRWNLMRQSSLARIVAHFSTRDVPRRLPDAVSIAGYRISQEALTNVIKHSKAQNVWVSLEYSGGTLHLEVRDDGVGFVSSQLDDAETMGMIGMQERAMLAAGRISVTAQPGMGCTVSVDFPFSDNRPC